MVVRKRLIFWLVKAYIKKSGKIIVISFFAGLLIFFAALFTANYLTRIIPIYRKVTIGVTGAYTEDNLPPIVLNKLSQGLTSVDNTGVIHPALASSWEISGKNTIYTFHLQPKLYFSDGREVTSDLIGYNFSDVIEKRPDNSTIIFQLKEPYAPFLVTVSRPIFQKGLVGVGDYKIQDIKLNGNFIQSLTLVSVTNHFDLETFQFYPTPDSLKLAYLMGEVTQAVGLTDMTFKGQKLSDFHNTTVKRDTNYDKLVTLFYNNNDGTLSDKRVRLALNYALQDTFSYGENTFVPYSEKSMFFNKDLTVRKQDISHAKLLLDAANISKLSLTIKTLDKYVSTAKDIAKDWQSLGIKTKIVSVDSVPNDFQVYLGDFNLSKDPDQYPLWHSDQPSNITKYKNLRIDKLLEDGRKSIDPAERTQIYADFQKYLLEDAPAAFLYFPYEYEAVRK
jgi:peptide/nickel transport system substrate-binding protein